MILRFALPTADPFLLPLGGLLTAVGLTMIYRIDPDLALRQGLWVVVGLAAFALLVVFLRDYRLLDRYKYILGLTAIFLLALPAVPHFGRTINGANLWVGIGGVVFQPGEFAKVLLVIFLAGYLRDNREMLSMGTGRFGMPSLKHFGPLLVIWGGAMLVLFQTNDLGGGLLYFSIFLAMLWVATARWQYVVVGLGLFAAGAYALYHVTPHVRERVSIWLDCSWTFSSACPVYDQGYQLAQSIYAISGGGFFGQGLGRGVLLTAEGNTYIPYLETDFIYAGIAQELGLAGAAGLVLVYVVFCYRGFKIALQASDGFSKLLAVGLTAAIGIQAFIIMGGVSGADPAHGHHAPLRLLRRVEHRRELRDPRLAPDDLRPREPRALVNAQVRKLFFVLVGLFVALIVMTTYWLWKAPDLEARQGNPQLIVQQLTIDRGSILASDGRTPFARNQKVRKKQLGSTWYLRTYPTDELAARPVGYSTIERSRTGLEESMNDYLTGSNANLDTLLNNTLDKLRGITQRGNDVITTIDAKAQRTAQDALAGHCGGAVALDPKTGQVLVWASQPTYDPNLVEGHFNQIQRDAAGAPCAPAAPLLDRISQGLFIPGSTFKVVTATAALESGKVTPSTTFDDPGYCIEYGKKVLNFADQSGPEVFGTVTFAEALENSINAVFCEVGKRFGARAIIDQAKKFGFYEKPPIQLPSDEISVSGLYQNGHLYDPKDPNAVDPGRLAFGQERLQVTPLQMALVAAAVANDGTIMQPTLVDRIVDPDGKVIQRSEPDTWKEAMKPQTAAELTAMMTAVVEGGTGVAAQIPGVPVAGKTGTAETGRPARTTRGSSPSPPRTTPRWRLPSRSPTRAAPAERPPRRSPRR